MTSVSFVFLERRGFNTIHTMRVLLLILVYLGALAECALRHRREIASTLPQEVGERYQNDVISPTPEQREGWKSQPTLSDKDGTEYKTLTGTNVHAPWESMRKEMNNMKVEIDVTKAAVSELNKMIEHILQVLDQSSGSHGQIEKEEDEDEENGDDDEEEESEENEDKDMKEKDNDYQEVNNTRVIITLKKKDDQLSCPPEFMDFDNQCIMLKADRRGSYAAAELECAKYKGHLAIPSNPKNLAFLATSFYPDSDEYWVGLRYNSTTKDWRKSDGNLDLNVRKLLGLKDKTDSSVGAECAVLKIHPTILWQARPCGYFYSFICEVDRVK
ncbi:uncharacterized protein LOC143040327 isoform X2 [Oratosquilla oratoria]|uniref:uncharacterized protein LOC143040327 isoform X2 n=1 Tax=Oratosquilla oratoria TaxID=337810 RepID=UPI003F76F085